MHNYVTEIYDKNNIQCDLYCFKPSITRHLKVMGNTLPKISRRPQSSRKKACEGIPLKENINKLWHMAYYEDWTLYKRYSEHLVEKIAATALGVAVDEAQQKRKI